jgi:hypothetical protein
VVARVAAEVVLALEVPTSAAARVVAQALGVVAVKATALQADGPAPLATLPVVAGEMLLPQSRSIDQILRLP